MSKRNVIIQPNELISRLVKGSAHAHDFTYKNPFLIATLYYTEGYSISEMAEALGCNHRTVRRYMNYYGYARFTKQFAQLVKAHGVQGARKIMKPEFYPLGVHND